MSFDLNGFMQAKLSARTTTVKVPELKGWFGDDAEPAFKVRGLTGEEFYQVREATAKRHDIQAMASKMFSGDGQAMAEAIEEFYGAVPAEYARRIEVLILGCVEPVLDRPAALKIFKNFPSTAHLIVEEILRATGEGSIVGESKDSGETPESGKT